MPTAHRVFLGGQAVSLLGDGVAILAVPLLVLQLTRDPLAAGLAAAPRGIGYLVVGVPAGPIVDRLSPWAVLITADLVRAGVFVALSVLSWLGSTRLWVVLGLAFLGGAATVFFDAALAVALKDLFRDEGLLRANAVVETANQTAQLLGPALVGVLAASVGIATALLINAGTFATSLLSLVIVAMTMARGGPAVRRQRRRPPHRRGVIRGLGRDFMEGLRFLGRSGPVLALSILFTVLNVFLAVDTLIAYLARVTLALPLPLVGVVVAGGGVGGVLGAVMASWLAARIRTMRLVALGVGVVAVTLLIMGISTAWWQVLAANGLQALAVVVLSVVNRSALQAWTPRNLLGRVTATRRLFVLSATPVGAVIVGVVTRAFDGNPRPAFAGAGMLMALIIGVGWRVALRGYDAVTTVHDTGARTSLGRPGT
jgi:MFS family permease